MRMNEINSHSSERKYVHLSNGLIWSFEIRYTFRIWICSGRCAFILWECHTCPLFRGGLQLRFAIFLYLKVCRNFEIWIHSIVRLDKRDKAYKAQAHCLTYTLTGLHEMFPPSTVTLSPVGPIAVKIKFSTWENSCLSITRVDGLLDKVYNSLKLRPQNLIHYMGVSVYRHLKNQPVHEFWCLFPWQQPKVVLHLQYRILLIPLCYGESSLRISSWYSSLLFLYDP